MGRDTVKKRSLSPERKNKLLFFGLAFAIPVVVILVSYIKMGIRPFGSNSMLGMDLWSQYFPMLRHQYESRRQLMTDMFSWDGAMGIDTFVQNAYYCNSPFNLLLLLSPLKYLIDAVDYLILFKFGLAGLGFAVYAKYKFKKLDIFTVAFSSAYALCSYCLAFISQVMWFDAVIFFPIILMGAERLITEKKPFLYCITLAVTIYSGFYISFSICLFLIIYFLIFAVENFKTLKIKGILTGGCRFALYSVLAGGLAAFVLLPVYFGLGRTIASDIPAPTSAELYHTLFECLSKLFPATPVSLQFDVPNIYSGCFILIMLPLFLLNKKIPMPRKIIYTLLVVFMYFSMNLNVLDYVWHGFHFPNQLPGRWTFIFSFIVILMSYEVVRNLDALEVPTIAVGAAAALFVFASVTLLVKQNLLSTVSMAMGIVFIGLYTAILIMTVKFRGDRNYSLATLLLAICIMVEMFANSAYMLYEGIEIGSVPKYVAYDEDMAYYKENFADSENEFYRSELYYNWTFDHCQLFGLKGLTYYSSTMDGAAYNFYKDLGYRVYAKNVSTVYCPYSPILNSVFNIKYVANLSMQYAPDYMKKVGENGNIEVLENERLLPVMFAASENVSEWTAENYVGAYEAQNRFFSAIMGEETAIYKKVPGQVLSVRNATIGVGSIAWGAQTFTRSDKNEDVCITYTYTALQDGSVYLNHNYKQGDMQIMHNGEPVSVILYREPMKYLGEWKKGDRLEITVTVSGVNVGTCGLELYTFDSELFDKCFQKLASQSTCEARTEPSGIICKINNKQDALMFTSIPAEGMTCTVDGVQTQILTVGDYLAAVKVPAGEHEVRFAYHTEGFTVGVWISVACAVVLAGLGLVKYGKKKKNIR